MNNHSKLTQAKNQLTATGQWPSVLRRYPQLQPALDALESGKTSHVACPFHGGKNDFRFYADAFESNRQSSKIAVCSCGTFTATDLIMKCEGVSRITREIVLMLEQAAGLRDGEPVNTAPPAAPTKRPPAKKRNPTVEATKWWNRSQRIDSAGLAYLTNRRLPVETLKLPTTLRYLPKNDYLVNGKCVYQGPALVAFLTRPDTTPAGIIRIFITNDGKTPVIENEGKRVRNKPMLRFGDSLTGSALRMEGDGTGIEHAGEGVETMLAIRACVPDTVNACGTASLLESWEPMPDTKTVMIWADNDENGRGLEAAEALQKRSSLPLTVSHRADYPSDSLGGQIYVQKYHPVPIQPELA